MTAEIRAWLRDLTDTHNAATAGVWHVAPSGGIDAGEYDTVIGRGPVDCMAYCYGGSSTIEGDNLPADAAAIVAEHNATPALVAALTAVLDLADQLGRAGGYGHRDSIADGIRAAVAAATDHTRSET